ncbi:hypothetical protein Ddc_10282 [Ditylenchus destructor]|nr:hypothetical protein Ddc_10282 [Ditylenchus destructor]
MMRQREAEFAFIANDSQMNDDFFDEESQPNSEYAATSERQMHGFLEYAAPLNREPDPNDFVYLLDDEEADPNYKQVERWPSPPHQAQRSTPHTWRTSYRQDIIWTDKQVDPSSPHRAIAWRHLIEP